MYYYYLFVLYLFVYYLPSYLLFIIYEGINTHIYFETYFIYLLIIIIPSYLLHHMYPDRRYFIKSLHTTTNAADGMQAKGGCQGNLDASCLQDPSASKRFAAHVLPSSACCSRDSQFLYSCTLTYPTRYGTIYFATEAKSRV